MNFEGKGHGGSRRSIRWKCFWSRRSSRPADYGHPANFFDVVHDGKILLPKWSTLPAEKPHGLALTEGDTLTSWSQAAPATSSLIDSHRQDRRLRRHRPEGRRNRLRFRARPRLLRLRHRRHLHHLRRPQFPLLARHRPHRARRPQHRRRSQDPHRLDRLRQGHHLLHPSLHREIRTALTKSNRKFCKFGIHER